jgi:hypothetical protein
VPIALTEEQSALQASVREWAERTGRDVTASLSLVGERLLGLPREESR